MRPHIKSWSGTLTNETAAKIAELINSVLLFRCTCVTIIKSLENVEVRPSHFAELKDGRVTKLVEDSPASISWSIDSYYTTIHVDSSNPVRVSWNGQQLTMRHNAPAGHPLVWIYAPEQDRDGEWISRTEED